MSTGAVSANLSQPNSYTSYLQQRQSELQQLGQDLQAGDLTDAQTEFNTIQSAAQNGPFGGDAFSLSNRQADFTALGQELQAGNLAGAQQAFSQLRNTFRQPAQSSNTSNTNAPSSTTGGGAEIVLNLANAPAGEQITINLSSGTNGNEQVAISASNPQNSNPEQITLNLNPNSNQEVVLNLFNSASGTQTQGSSGVSVSA
ncbi:MAG TPA: hypothetical protein VMD99_03530 [Terriglobales bacterium]|jgi:hypothetical protein|nr:hypothetical protein [Terriglobales bacterium]